MDAWHAAQAALAAHDALRATHESEPPCDEEGMPHDALAWMNWRANVSVPAYDNWSAAMDSLDAALGHSVSRHPFNFRPICEEILAGKDAAAMREP